jgi:tetratricopeptide (TPR) repeat protein
MKFINSSLAIIIALSSLAANADLMSDVNGLQKSWVTVNYTLKGDAQEDGFEDLIKQADDIVDQYPNSAESLIWRGIIKASYAGAKGGLGAMSLAKSSKKDLEQAMSIDSDAMLGAAYASLGTLYYKVPGWPIGFGDDDKAKELLEKAIAINPNGIDSNYFYASFMFDQDELAQAEKYLNKAKAAAPRPERPKADQGRHKEIETLLAKVHQKQQDEESD